MTAPREELHSLVDDIPDEEVPAVLALIRGRLAAGTTWPPVVALAERCRVLHHRQGS